MQQQHNFEWDARIAWAAGLFEGEGCLCIHRRSSAAIQVTARLAMGDRDVVDRFAAVVGFGRCRYEVHRGQKPAWKPMHEWAVHEAAKVRALVEMFLPWFGDRRADKALEVLAVAARIQPRNALRTHCPKGHPYEGANLVIEMVGPRGAQHPARRCRICRNDQARQRKRRELGITPDRYRV